MSEYEQLLRHCNEVKAELLKERLRSEKLERRVKALRHRNRKLSHIIDILRDLLATSTAPAPQAPHRPQAEEPTQATG